MWRESVKMSWANIIHNKMRSFLTILGIVIGVASIIALITIVKSATYEVTNQFSTLGAETITVQAVGTPLKQGLTDNDIKLLGQVAHVAGVSPTLSGKATVVNGKKVMDKVSVQGKNEVYFTHDQDTVSLGRGINLIDIKSKNKVCLLGANLVSQLYYGENPIDETMLVNGVSYKIIGILKKSSGFSLTSNNNSVVIPYTTAMSFLGTRYISSVEVYMENSVKGDQITADIQTVLNQAFNYKQDAYTIVNMEDVLDMVNNMTGMLSMMLVGIASISLVVGGIGIMNMMLVSVTERTAEIGLRKALGAEPKRIQEQFLIEAVFLSSFGGVIGLGLGIGIAYLGTLILEIPFLLSGSTIILAISFSAAIGIVFGLAPARKASALNPIDALRSV